MMKTNTITAVVVTYNRLTLLKECIEALRLQTLSLDNIIVVNNSSTDGTQEWLSKQQGITTVTQENRGGSFGFYTGIKTAFEQEYEWIWCMDDDGRPDEKALEELMKHKHRKPCVMNGLVLDNKDSNRIVFKTADYTQRSQINERELINGAANPYNSTLFHAGVIEKAGLPRPELIIWGDETEYFNRIKYKHIFSIFTVIKSLHFHPAQSGKFYQKEWDLSFGWKVFYYVRNKRFVYGSQYRSPARSLLAYGKFLAGFMGTIIIYQKKERWKKMRLLYKAAQDGFKNNTSKEMPQVQALLRKL